MAMRMVCDGAWKLIWYPAGNKIQLFDRVTDPQEKYNVAEQADNKEILSRLTEALIKELYGEDLKWINENGLTGFEPPILEKSHNR